MPTNLTTATSINNEVDIANKVLPILGISLPPILLIRTNNVRKAKKPPKKAAPLSISL